jgi:hypothetical protein
MPEYKTVQATGQMTSWRRAENIVMRNPLNGIPSVECNEENIISLPDGTIMQGPAVTDPKIVGYMTDPTTTFNLLNPSTGAVVGTATYMQLYVMMYSLFYDLAVARDAKMIADAAAAAAKAAEIGQTP